MKSKRKGSQGQEQQASSTSASPATPTTPSFSPPELPPLPTVTLPPLEWEGKSRRLGALLQSATLPLVVTVDQRCAPPMDSVNFDFTQPLLLHTKRKVRKVEAANVVHVQQESGAPLKEVGNRLLIPEDYKGWFAVLGKPDDVKPDRVVPHFRQVAQLALSKCESFLIGGNEPVKAVQLPSGGTVGNTSHAQARHVYPGDVLRMGKVYVGESTIKVKKRRLFGGKETIKKEEKFLLCTDDNDRELYLPVESRGTFYMLTTEGHGSPKIPILRMPDICTHFRFPCVVRLLFGRVPTTPCSFTGTLALHASHLESSVIGCTMLNVTNILLDIPTDSDLSFFAARATSDLLNCRAYANAKALCHDKAATYMRNMKVAYYINEDEEEEDPASQSSAQNDESMDASDRSSTLSSTSRLSRSRPSIVEDQGLFCPPPTSTSSTPSTSTIKLPGSKKRAKKSQSMTDQPRPRESNGSPSPTILRKDPTFSLPEEREVLPLRPSKSMPSVAMENRPPNLELPPRQPSDTQPSDSHYVPMDSSGKQAGTDGGVSPESPERKRPPAPPPKPPKQCPPAHSRSDSSLYTKLWDGRAQIEPPIPENSAEEPEYSFPSSSRRATVSAGSTPSPSPAVRPTNLEVRPAAHRVSGLTVADTYLALPMFTGGAIVNSPEYPEPAGRPAARASNRTLSESSEIIYKIPRLSGSSLSVVPTSMDQPYETMSRVADSVPPSLPPKTRTPSSPPYGNGAVPKAQPVPCHRPKIELQNPSWMFSDVTSSNLSSTAWHSGLQGGEAGEGHAPGEAEPEAEYVPMHQMDNTFYHGCDDPDNGLPQADTTTAGREKGDPPPEDDPDQTTGEGQSTSGADSDEVLYQNIQNLRLYKDELVTSGRVNSQSSLDTENRGSFFNKVVNPPSVFGYVSPPPARRLTPKKPPPVAAKPKGKLKTRGDSVESGGSASEGGLTSPPRPCGVNDGYLRPCLEQTDRVDYLHPTENPDALFPVDQPGMSSSMSDVSSRQSGDIDDLPLGATFANFRSPVSDSGCALESVVGMRVGGGGRRTDGSEVSSMSVADLGEALKDVGLMKQTVEILQREKVDGQLLVSLDEDDLKEALPGVKSLEIKKICMFVNGWRPRE